MDEIITKFVTFYSYKGGVGRTSALVNVAIFRALEGNNVVIVDFDLEAPGTSPYLKKLDPALDEHREGILEYFAAAINGIRAPSLFEHAIDLTPRLNSKNKGHLWVISAGNTKDRYYAARLEQLRWSEIFEKKYGELLLKNFKNQIIKEFHSPDYVFVDSRTGITETAGVCTRYLADILVILTSLNEQNIRGTATIHKELSKEAKETVLVAANVPIGMPNERDQLFFQRIETFIDAFGKQPDLFVYYYPVLSLSEELPILFSSHNEKEQIPSLFRTDPLLQSYRRLGAIIDRDREGQTSYMALLRKAANELLHFVYSGDQPSEIDVLKQYYSDRLLAQLIFGIFAFARSCTENQNPAAWDIAEYKRLVEISAEPSNSAVKEAVGTLRLVLYQSLMKYLDAGGIMDRSFEDFVEEHHLRHLVLQAISARRYTWPIDYLQRSLESLPEGDRLQRTCDLYNLSHCLLRIGDTTAAEQKTKLFLEEFKQLDFTTSTANAKANFYFCGALAYSRLGLRDEAKIMRKKSEEQLGMLKPVIRVFSPLEYKPVPIDQFRKQLAESFKQ